MASFCSKCGTAATTGVRFCANCGAALDAGVAPPAGSPPPPPPGFATPAGAYGASGQGFSTAPAQKGPSTLLWVVLGIVLALLVAFGSCAYVVIHKARQAAMRVRAEMPRFQKQLEEKAHEVAAASDVCTLVTPSELADIYGAPFADGERQGQSCSFTKTGQSQPAVTIRLDHSLSRFDREAGSLRPRNVYSSGEVRSFFTNPSTLHVGYRWNYLEISAEGGREKCFQIEKLVLKHL